METKLLKLRKETIKSSIKIFGIEKTIRRISSRISLAAIEELLQEDESIREQLNSLPNTYKIDLLEHLNSLKSCIEFL